MKENIFCDFEIQRDHTSLVWRPDLMFSNKKRRTCQLVDFTILADHRSKIKGKIDNYPDLAKKQKNLRNMKVIVIQFVVGALGMVSKGL